MSFDLSLDDEQRALKETLHDFAEGVLRPAARDAESAGRTSDEILRQIHEIGVAAPVPEEHGGGGTFDALTYCIAAEELAWGDPGIAHHALSSGLAAVVIGLAGSDEQRSKYLPRFAEDRPIASFVATGEKIAAGDVDSLETRVDGGKVVGDKYGVVGATEAAFGVVVGRSDAGLAAAIVESDAWDIVRPEAKLGLEAAPSAVVRFDGEADALPSGDGLTKGLLWSKLLSGGVALGCARASFEYASQYATEREAFGRPIGAFQAISFKIADMATEVDAARIALWRAAWLIERGEASFEDVHQALGQVFSAAVKCGDDGVQVLGGHGYIRDHLVEKWFRDAVTLSVFDAPDVLGDALVGSAAGAKE